MYENGWLAADDGTGRFADLRHAEASVMGVFKQLFVDIGDDQSIESDLSTYSAHLSKMKKFVEQANGKTLILIDEFGTGTDPQFGGPIAEAVLESLKP